MHTPGPWRIDPAFRIGKDGGRHGYVEVSGTKAALWICKVQAFSLSEDEHAANARLISAAPDLLEALKAMLDIAPFATNEITGQIHRQAEAAIKKAEGA